MSPPQTTSPSTGRFAERSLGCVEGLKCEWEVIQGAAGALPLMSTGWGGHSGKGLGTQGGRHLHSSCCSSKTRLEAAAGEQSSPPKLQMPHLCLCWHHNILQRGLGCSINGTRGEFSLCCTNSDAKGLTLPLAHQRLLA